MQVCGRGKVPVTESLGHKVYSIIRQSPLGPLTYAQVVMAQTYHPTTHTGLLARPVGATFVTGLVTKFLRQSKAKNKVRSRRVCLWASVNLLFVLPLNCAAFK